MSCYNNPQGFTSVPLNNGYTNGVANTNNMNSGYSNQAADSNLYVQQNQWGEPVTVNPNDPTSPLSVQPDGRSTPFTAGMESITPLPETLTQTIYTPGYLHKYIGRLMRVEFLVGNQTTDRVGYLREVGASYIVLESVDNANLMMCDLYSIKFATILRENMAVQLAHLYEEA